MILDLICHITWWLLIAWFLIRLLDRLFASHLKTNLLVITLDQSCIHQCWIQVLSCWLALDLKERLLSVLTLILWHCLSRRCKYYDLALLLFSPWLGKHLAQIQVDLVQFLLFLCWLLSLIIVQYFVGWHIWGDHFNQVHVCFGPCWLLRSALSLNTAWLR